MADDLILQVGFGVDDSQVTRTLQSIAQKANKAFGAGINANAFIQPLGRITGKANEFQKSLEASNARVIAFGASAGAIFALRSAFEKLVSSTIQVEKSLADINALLGLSTHDLQAFSNNLFKIANQTGNTFINAAKAATEFSRQGLGVEDTLKRTAAALTLSRLSGLSFEESVSSLTGTLNSFVKEALDAEDVINRLTAVDARYAVSAGDLAKGLSRVGASANDANVTLNQTIALITAAQQVTSRGGSVIGNAFKTIFTRLQRPEVLDDLESAGVQVRDLQGKVRPLIDVLKNLATTYDGLSGAQKSFVAETVGGVYQINILKAIMTDLGSGTSIVQGALKVAGDSAGSAESRLKTLNDTISSQLLRTMNELTRAAYNVGNALLGGTTRKGLSSLDELLKQISDFTDPSKALEGGVLKQVQSNAGLGVLKGLGNILSGPGLQAGIIIIIKLFERLQKFIVDSAKDLVGLDKGAKERGAIEKQIGDYLARQNQEFEALVTGQKTINQVAKEYVTILQSQNALLKTRDAFTKGIANIIAPQVSIKKTAATGFVPNLFDPEQQSARDNHYFAGSTISRTIRNGLKSVDILANSRETISTVTGNDGLPYDFINPPESTSAWNKHRQNSIRATGIDPMRLSRKSMAGGFVPNLASLTPDNIEPFVRAFFNKPHQIGQIEALMRSVRKKGLLPADEKGLRHYLGGVILAKKAFPGVTASDADKLTSMITGVDVGQRKSEALATKTTTLNPEDVQAVLSRYAEDFPAISAYTDAKSLSPARNFRQNFPIAVGANNFNIPVQGLGHSSGSEYFKVIQDKLKGAGKFLGLKGNLELPSSTFGAGFGAIFDATLRGFFKERGIEVGDINSPIDILGYHPDIAQYIGTNKAFAGAEIKASSNEIGTLPPKIFRMLAGDPSTGVLKGPVSKVPPLRNIGIFNNSKGNVGILDWDAFKTSVSRKENDFHSLVYSAIASGKPLKVNYGPMGSGKTTDARHLADKLGGGFVFNRKDALGEDIDQFILTTTAISEDSLQKGVFGLAFGAASNIEAFNAAPQGGKSAIDVLRQRIAQRGRDNESPEILISQSKMLGYEKAFEYLRKTFGGLGRFKTRLTASGFVPNLATEDSMGDLAAKLGYYSNQHKFFSAVAGQATSFVRGNPDIMNKFPRRDDSEYLIAALTNKISGREVGHDQVILNKLGISDSYIDVLHDALKAQVNVPELSQRIKKGEYASGFVPNLALKFKKTGKYSLRHQILDNEDKSYLSYYNGKDALKMGFIESKKKGKGYKMFQALARISRRVQKPIYSEELLPQLKKLNSLDSPFHSSNAEALLSQGQYSNFDILLHATPQLKYRMTDNLKSLSGKLAIDKSSKAFASLDELKQIVQGLGNPRDFLMAMKMGDIQLENVYTEYAAKGFVPNLNTNHLVAIKEALHRENKATGGRAMLDMDSSLATSQNPFGLAAIDKRQGSAKKAIQEHLTFQTMGQIKNARTSSGGFVPNLAITDNVSNSLMLAVFGYASNLVQSTEAIQKLALKFPLLASQTDVEIAHQKNLIGTYEKLRDELLTGVKTQVEFNGKTHTSALGLEQDFKPKLQAFVTNIKANNEALAASQKSLSGLGFKTAIASSLAGGIGSQVAGRFSPTAGAGIDVLSTGITNAGQALIAFPNRIGKVIGAGLLTSGFVGALDVFSKGLETSQRNFETQQSVSQKLTAQIDSLAVSVNNLDSLVNDSSVTTSTLNRENRKFIDTLNQIKQTPRGRDIATSIETAPDAKTRLRLLDDFKQQENSKLERLANNQAVRELAAKRSFDLGPAHFSSGTFAFSNPFEKEGTQQAILGTASTAISGISDAFRDKLIGSVESLEKFNQTIDKFGDADFKNFLDNIRKTGTEGDRNLIVQQIRSLLASQRLQNEPAIAKARQDLLARNESRQLRLDDAIRKEQTTRRLFVNQGSLQGGNILDLRQISNTLNSGLTNIFRSQSRSGLFQLRFGELTNRAFSTSTDIQRIEAERKFKANTLSTQTSRSVIDLFSQSFDDTIKGLESLKGIGTNQTSTNVSDFKLTLIEGLNKGIANVISQGNIDRFQKGGQFDFSKFEESIAKNSGTTPDFQRQIQNFLQNNRSVELLKTIQNANTQLVNINQEALTEAEKQTIAFEAFKKENNFKQLSSFLGGVRSLLDRNTRRSLEREAIRGATLLRTGTTPEAKAVGAASLLNFFKTQNIPLDLSGRNPLSKLMQEAWVTAGKGLADVQQKSLGRIIGSVSRLGASPSVLNGLNQFGAVNFNQTAQAALESEFKPENAQILNEATKLNVDSMIHFNIALKNSIGDVADFGRAIKTTKNDLLKAILQREGTRLSVSKEGQLDVEKFNKIVETLSKKFEDALKVVEPQRKTNVFGNISGSAALGVGLASAAAQFFLYKQQGKVLETMIQGAGPKGVVPTSRPSTPSITSIPYPQRSGITSRDAQGRMQPIPSSDFTTFVPENMRPKPRAPKVSYRSISGRMVSADEFGTSVPENFRTSRPPIAPAVSVPSPGFGPRTSRGIRIGGGLAGAIALPLLGNMAAQHIDNPYASNALSIGSAIGGPLLAGQFGRGALGLASLLKMGGFGVGAGGSLAGIGAAGGLGVAGLAAGTAIGGFALGNKIYKGASGISNIEKQLSSGQYTESTGREVLRLLKAGKSGKEIEASVNIQIGNTERQLADARGGLSKYLGTKVTGTGGIETALLKTLEELKNIKANVGQAKSDYDSQNQQQKFQADFLKAIQKLADGSETGGGSAQVQSSIKVEISLKDAESMPDILTAKLIEPLKKQLADLQNQANSIKQHINMSPSPARIGT